jgi:hypothetical protein
LRSSSQKQIATNEISIITENTKQGTTCGSKEVPDLEKKNNLEVPTVQINTPESIYSTTVFSA